ncbi:10469_t:CDS:2, partial [Funneliformis geosporum]
WARSDCVLIMMHSDLTYNDILSNTAAESSIIAMRYGEQPLKDEQIRI